MEQNYHTIEDKDTNIVYLSEWLKKEHHEFFTEFTTLLDNIGIEWALLPHSNDYWCRDFMPIQMQDNVFLKYWYHPSYLLDTTDDRASITNSITTCNLMGIPYTTSKIIIDGGNVVPCGNKIVMTTHVFSENKVREYDTKFIVKLQKFLQHEVIFIPWHQDPEATLENGDDVFGHADGVIKYCGDNRILMSYDGSEDAIETVRILENNGYEVTKMTFPDTKHEDQTWAYINFLQVGNKIIMPRFDISEDIIAKDYIQSAFPYSEIHQIDMHGIEQEGGALHCLTWNIKKVA